MADSGATPRTPRQQRVLDESTPAVHTLAKQNARRVGMTEEELFQIGMEALLTLLATYETWNVPFMKASYKRIRGAMIDASRKDRRSRAQAHAMERASEPFDNQVEMGNVFDEPSEMRRERYEDALYTRAITMTLALTRPSPTPEEELETEQNKTRIREELERALAQYPSEDQQLFKMHAIEEVPLVEAAVRVDMHPEKARARYNKMAPAVGRWFARAGQSATL